MVFRPFPTIRTGGSMKIIDISQEVFSCQLYPGDPSPVMNRMMSIVEGDAYNLTGFSMCAHNGTHIDAPFHFLQNGRSVDQMGLEPYVGTCFVARHDGDVSSKDAERIIKKASAVCADKRILIAGQATVTAGAAHVFAESKILLLGNEGPTIGPLNTPSVLQRCFIENGAVQCGFCTPGMLMSAYALLQHNPCPSRQEIREAISGNLCRCTGYVPIINSIEAAVKASAQS